MPTNADHRTITDNVMRHRSNLTVGGALNQLLLLLLLSRGIPV